MTSACELGACQGAHRLAAIPVGAITHEATSGGRDASDKRRRPMTLRSLAAALALTLAACAYPSQYAMVEVAGPPPPPPRVAPPALAEDAEAAEAAEAVADVFAALVPAFASIHAKH
jgi:hypothetical protein